MLRARPIHYTSRPEDWAAILHALGLVKTVDDGEWLEFDAGSGRLALGHVEHGHPLDGSTLFSVEVGDVDEFVRRTEEAGTQAEIHETPDATTARISADDGFEFFAFPATRAADGTWATSPEADPALAVVATWVSPLVELSAGVLRGIGARPRTSDDESATFTTKNGGILQIIHGADGTSGVLAFEYDGELEPLLARLTEAATEARISEGILYVANPDAAGGAAPASIVVERAPA
ncbi:hypothetical protein IRJ34_03375 [Paenarthrobacter sp. GOM3]|uniref:hypothetical protein n=1 Tax=Paenarthrobacter sp. GOM3 TaxID=2782567 RepID=UPI001BA575AF|nr:hypothetical protein [Paenarthrobacter sp. GOM3]WOH19380.1 hypothetical protein IRJ34_03375 [Paenarthrobacter sp. GOM3]